MRVLAGFSGSGHVRAVWSCDFVLCSSSSTHFTVHNLVIVASIKNLPLGCRTTRLSSILWKTPRCRAPRYRIPKTQWIRLSSILWKAPRCRAPRYRIPKTQWIQVKFERIMTGSDQHQLLGPSRRERRQNWKTSRLQNTMVPGTGKLSSQTLSPRT